MANRKKVIINFICTIIIITFSTTLFAFASSYNYTSMTQSTAFKTYSVIITAKTLNIRKTPSSSGKMLGRYVKGNVVDIIGKSGRYLKTNKGYIAEAYTKKYIIAFKTYKVFVSSDKLNIRSTPNSDGKILGNYNGSDIIDIVGKSGVYLKTSKGYIAESYTNKLIGAYISVSEDVQVVNSSTGKLDDRFVVPQKYYFVVGSKDNNILIKIGSIRGYIPQNIISSASVNPKNKITVGWEYVNSKSKNILNYDEPTDYVNRKSNELGLDVVSPTWFDVTGDYKKSSTIKINDIADKNYVTIAHNNGYMVWARFSEMDKNRAAVEFKDKSVRTRLIDQIINLSKYYDLDGINVDYEALGSANKDGFTDFMKELYTKLRAANLNTSVDITKISPTSSLYSMCYDRPSLAKYSDYLMLMGYDEHVSSSKQPGSVGSYNWVDQSIKDILKQGVPQSKLILAVPFYLRDYAVIPYDAIILNKASGIYRTGISIDNNILLNSKQGNVFKCVGSDGDWFIVDYNGNKGYILSKNSTFIKSNTPPVTTDSSIVITTGGGVQITTGGAIDIVLPYDAVITNQDCTIYRTESEAASNKLSSGAAKSYYKYISTQGEWYAVEYNGNKGYIPKSSASFYKAESQNMSSSALSMNAVQDRIQKYGGSIYYDKIARQNVGTYNMDGLKHVVWLETNESMAWRMDLINSYGLPGAAAWSLYWKPTDGIWETIKAKLKN